MSDYNTCEHLVKKETKKKYNLGINAILTFALVQLWKHVWDLDLFFKKI